MTSASWTNARNWRMRAEECRAFASDMNEAEPKAIMLRIAEDYDRLAEWAEKNAGTFFPGPETGSQLTEARRIAANVPKIPDFCGPNPKFHSD